MIVSAGGKQALYNSVLALFGPGDEVITHMPGWPTLVEQIKLAEATPVIVRTHVEDGFRITADLILAAVTPRTKGIIINSPGNPTGALISEADVEAIAKAAAKRGIWVLLDLCYDRLVYDPVPHNIIGVLSRRLRDRAVLCGSASKAYAMTGWRCGWVVGPKELIGACNAIQSHSTSNACSISQRAAEAALRGPQECVTEMLDEYRRRRDQLYTWLSADPRIRMVKPAGAFYMFPDVSDFLSPDGIRTSGELAAALLSEAHVAADARRGVRRARLPADLIRDVDEGTGARLAADPRVPGEPLGPCRFRLISSTPCAARSARITSASMPRRSTPTAPTR